MTPERIGCNVPYCKRKAVEGVKTCAKHRAMFVKHDRLHNQRAREAGHCIHCPQPPRTATRGEFKGKRKELRCEAHALVNTNRINKWAAEHPDRGKKAWQLKKALRKMGFCPYCREHRALAAGESRCKFCQIREQFGWEVMRAAEKTPSLVKDLLAP